MNVSTTWLYRRRAGDGGCRCRQGNCASGGLERQRSAGERV